MKNKLTLAASAWLLSTTAMAGETIQRGPAPDWIPAVSPHLSNRPDSPSQHIRYEVLESHVRAFGSHSETYARMRLRVLSPLGLQQASQLALMWNPALQSPTVHHARIIRDDQTYDILDKADFTILRREAGLEQSLQINGILTGVLVNPDIRVGDTLDYAYSIRTQFDLFNNPLELATYSYSPLPVDLSAMTISWPASMNVQTRAGRHASVPPITQQGDFKVLSNRMTDVEAAAFPETLSARSLPDYGWQVSSIPQWRAIADRIRPAYDQAAALPDAADLAAQVAQIKATHATPEARALAALRLVQDEVRYMALTLGESGWLPTSAADVWSTRQGDCKGKTVLLVALLRELGIDAVPVLVSSTNLPLDRYLPMVGAFDHVVVKARINGETYLMDGARIGDRSLTPDIPLVHEYVLPVAPNADLEQIPLRLPPRPTGMMHLEIDFSDGIYSPARLTLSDVDRGDSATSMLAGVAQVPAAELTRWYDERWNTFLKDFGRISDLKSEWQYDDETHEFVARATARISFDWSSGPLNIPLAHVTWKGFDPLRDERFADADYAKSFPGSSLFRTTLILPEGEDVIDLSVQPYDVEAGATRYFRTVQRNGNRLETDRGSTTLRPYATAAEVQVEQAALDSFKDLKATMQIRRGYTMTAADRESLTTVNRGDPDAALRRGYVLHNQADYAGAIAQFDVAIAGFATPNANAFANRALSYLALEDLDKARADIAAGEAADPNDAILFHAKGRLAEIENDDLEAVLAFTGALREWPENTHALNRRAAAYDRMGQSARALADLERLAVLEPQSNSVKSALAAQLLKMGRAEQAYEQVGLLAQSIGHPDAKTALFVGMSQALASSLKETDPAKAENVLTEALAVETDFPALLIDRAAIREMRSDSRGAAADRARFHELTSINLDDPRQACISQALSRHSRDAALRMCDAALGQSANDAELHTRRGFLLNMQNRISEALAAYRTASELDPANQKARYGLGHTLKQSGETAEGEALMATALQADPTANEGYDAVLVQIQASN